MRLLQSWAWLFACLASFLLATPREEPSCIANEVIRALSVLSPSRDSLVSARYYLRLSAELRLQAEEYMKIDAEVQICVTVRAVGEDEHGEQWAPDTGTDTDSEAGRGTVVHQQCGLRAFDEIQVPGVPGRNSLQVELLHSGRRLCWAQVQVRCCMEAGDALEASRGAARAKTEAFFAAGSGFAVAIAATEAGGAGAQAEAGAEWAGIAGERGVNEVLAGRLWETRQTGAGADACFAEEGKPPPPTHSPLPVLRVVVGIKSGALNLHKRQLLRHTWLASLDTHNTQSMPIRIKGQGQGQGQEWVWVQQRVQFVPFFLVGRYEADTGTGTGAEAEAEAERVRGQLRAEQRLYGDLLLGQLPVRDSYHTLGQKLLLFLAWVFERVAAPSATSTSAASTSTASTSGSGSASASGVDYVLVCDDDVFVHVAQLTRYLLHREREQQEQQEQGGQGGQGGQREPLYAGEVLGARQQHVHRPQRDPAHRNYLSTAQWPADFLPPLALGNFYLLSAPLAAYMSRNRDLRPTGTLEDLSVAVWAMGVGVFPTHLPGVCDLSRCLYEHALFDTSSDTEAETGAETEIEKEAEGAGADTVGAEAGAGSAFSSRLPSSAYRHRLLAVAGLGSTEEFELLHAVTLTQHQLCDPHSSHSSDSAPSLQLMRRALLQLGEQRFQEEGEQGETDMKAKEDAGAVEVDVDVGGDAMSSVSASLAFLASCCMPALPIPYAHTSAQTQPEPQIHVRPLRLALFLPDLEASLANACTAELVRCSTAPTTATTVTATASEPALLVELFTGTLVADGDFLGTLRGATLRLLRGLGVEEVEATLAAQFPGDPSSHQGQGQGQGQGRRHLLELRRFLRGFDGVAVLLDAEHITGTDPHPHPQEQAGQPQAKRAQSKHEQYVQYMRSVAAVLRGELSALAVAGPILAVLGDVAAPTTTPTTTTTTTATSTATSTATTTANLLGSFEGFILCPGLGAGAGAGAGAGMGQGILGLQGDRPLLQLGPAADPPGGSDATPAPRSLAELVLQVKGGAEAGAGAGSETEVETGAEAEEAEAVIDAEAEIEAEIEIEMEEAPAIHLGELDVVLGSKSLYASALLPRLLALAAPSLRVGRWFVLEPQPQDAGAGEEEEAAEDGDDGGGGFRVSRLLEGQTLQPLSEWAEVAALRARPSLLLLGVLDCGLRVGRCGGLVAAARGAVNASRVLFLSGEPIDLSQLPTQHIDLLLAATTDATLLPPNLRPLHPLHSLHSGALDAPDAHFSASASASAPTPAALPFWFLPVFAGSFLEMRTTATTTASATATATNAAAEAAELARILVPSALLSPSGSRDNGVGVGQGQNQGQQGQGARTRGAAYLYHRCDRAQREQFFDTLREQFAKARMGAGAQVEALGRCKGAAAVSAPTTHGQGQGKEQGQGQGQGQEQDSRFAPDYLSLAVQAYRPYRFVLAFENTAVAGYATEKLTNAFLAGAVPVYWGAPDVSLYFNPLAMINCADFGSPQACAEWVVQVHGNETLYRDMRAADPVAGKSAAQRLDVWAALFPWEYAARRSPAAGLFEWRLRNALFHHLS